MMKTREFPLFSLSQYCLISPLFPINLTLLSWLQGFWRGVSVWLDKWTREDGGGTLATQVCCYTCKSVLFVFDFEDSDIKDIRLSRKHNSKWFLISRACCSLFLRQNRLSYIKKDCSFTWDQTCWLMSYCAVFMSQQVNISFVKVSMVTHLCLITEINQCLILKNVFMIS